MALTRQQILALSGRELDKAVAEALGWEDVRAVLDDRSYVGISPNHPERGLCPDWKRYAQVWTVPYFSGPDWGPLRQVIEHATRLLANSDFHLEFECCVNEAGEIQQDGPGRWLAFFPGPTDAYGATAPEAACRSFLLAQHHPR
jgi:hypothetical protein